MKHSFLDLDENALRGTVAIVDIDGTLAPDRHDVLDEAIAQKLILLNDVAQVYLFSNGSAQRTRTLALRHGVSCLESPHLKPDARVIASLELQGAPLVVIGDKTFTDGLFAAAIGARFLQVTRLRHERELFLTRAHYALDDMLGFFAPALYALLPYALLMRPQQWIKNALVFAPLFFAGRAFSPLLAWQAALAALVFCAAASAMYVFNDMADVERDRLHSIKKLRPLALGTVSVLQARILLLFLGIAVAAGLFALPVLAPAIFLYVAGNFVYSAKLKTVPVIDIICIASFYVLRIVAGGTATAVEISPWIILCVFFGALFLAIGKRRAEFAQFARREVLNHYAPQALDHLLAGCALLAVAAYGLYSVLGAHSPLAVYSTAFVFAAIGRLLNRLYRGEAQAEYPEILVFKDRWVLALMTAWAGYMALLLYWV